MKARQIRDDGNERGMIVYGVPAGDAVGKLQRRLLGYINTGNLYN